MFVIGTAGHIDHGKSSLVEAMTGIDPDRLQEEKDRGITIDLGFAWLTLPQGQEISIVDVPGHERFVNNMLAGVGAIDAALLIIAADESVMPQTVEHVAILNLLGIKKGVVAISKSDLVDRDWIELVSEDVNNLLKGTTLEGSPVHSVSAVTKEGIPELLKEIENTLISIESKKDFGRPVLPIDRSFSVAGFGTVVTGTLMDGSFTLGQEVHLEPSGISARVRGIQMHKNKSDKALPGNRVAINLTGVEHGEIKRGDILTIPSTLELSEAFDVHLSVLDDAPNVLKHNMFVTFHHGSSESIVKLRLLEYDTAEPGASTWAQIKCESPLPVSKGDHFVIRSNMTTLGGGKVVDIQAIRHRMGDEDVIRRLNSLEFGSPKEIIVNILDTDQPMTLTDLARDTNSTNLEITNHLEQLIEEGNVFVTDKDLSKSYIYAKKNWQNLVVLVKAYLGNHHMEFPLRKGLPREELREYISQESEVYNGTLKLLSCRGVIVEEKSVVRLVDHKPVLNADQETQTISLMEKLKESPFTSTKTLDIGHELINFLVEQQKLVKIDDQIIFHIDTYENIVSDVTKCIKDQGNVTVADVRDMLGTSRKYALSIMDYLDQQQITKRVGDTRILR